MALLTSKVWDNGRYLAASQEYLVVLKDGPLKGVEIRVPVRHSRQNLEYADGFLAGFEAAHAKYGPKPLNTNKLKDKKTAITPELREDGDED